MNYAQRMFEKGLMPTRRQKVLSMLIEARIKNEPFCIYENQITHKRHYVSGGYLPTWAFRGQYAGGDCGDRRCRELRADHKPDNMPKNDWIEKKTHVFQDWDSINGVMKDKSVVIFRLTMPPNEVLTYPWGEAFTLPFNWIYKEIKGQINCF